jgi:hypothetical protein
LSGLAGGVDEVDEVDEVEKNNYDDDLYMWIFM